MLPRISTLSSKFQFHRFAPSNLKVVLLDFASDFLQLFTKQNKKTIRFQFRHNLENRIAKRFVPILEIWYGSSAHSFVGVNVNNCVGESCRVNNSIYVWISDALTPNFCFLSALNVRVFCPCFGIGIWTPHLEYWTISSERKCEKFE